MGHSTSSFSRRTGSGLNHDLGIEAVEGVSTAAPLIASSGQTHRHRLNRRGNRQLNWALHYIALVQSRTTPEARAYLARQREAGKSHKEAMRCLKRHLSNVVYRAP